jgi:hypothetical protein
VSAIGGTAVVQIDRLLLCYGGSCCCANRQAAVVL